MNSRGITAISSYIPAYRLTAAEIARARRTETTSKASRAVSGFDEDSATMAVEAGRRVVNAVPGPAISRIGFLTTTPPYEMKNNASVIHAALGLRAELGAYDLGTSLRSTLGSLTSSEPGSLILAADVGIARPGADTELSYGDAAAAALIGNGDEVVLALEGAAGETDEILDHWRLRGESASSTSEDRFVLSVYKPILERVLARLDVDAVDHVIVSAPSSRVATMARRQLSRLGPAREMEGVGYCGAADALVQVDLALANVAPGDRLLVVGLIDGCDAILFRATERVADRPTIDYNSGAPADVGYLDYLAWRGFVERETPRRPAPNAVSPPAAARGAEWKFALQASRCTNCSKVASPPQRVCVHCGSTGPTEPIDLSRVGATVKTFSVDRLAFSLNPPVVAAIVDFDGGGRLEVEMTDSNPATLEVGQRVRMVFRRRHSSGGIHNYAWKATRGGLE